MYNLIKLNLARNALRYIIKLYDVKEIYIPYYLCDVIRQCVIKEKCKPIFYHINDNFFPTDNFPKNAFILYPDYFGICKKNVEILTTKYENIIIDNAHSFFSPPKGLACFNSARKFLPVQNGSYLWIKKAPIKLLKEEEPFFMPKNEFEKEKNEILFNYEDIKILNHQTAENIKNLSNKEKILKNFYDLHEKYSKNNLLKINVNDVESPFCYPLLCASEIEADKIVNELKLKNIIVYRYWNKLPTKFNEYKFYSRLVAIPL